MGLFESIFGRQPKVNATEYFRTLTAYQPTFTSHKGGLYEMDATRSAIHAVATHCSKLKPHANGSAAQKYKQMLLYRPNPWQTTSQFLYRLATILEVENTAFIVPIYNEFGTVVGLYPVLPQRVQLVKAGNNQLYLRYEFASGQYAAVEYAACGVMTKMQYADDIFGANNNAIAPTLDLLSVQNQGITEGIKSAAAIRFMAKLGSTLRPEDLKKEQENFRKLNFASDNNGGVLMFDQKYAEVKQIDSKPYIVDAEQMKLIDNNVYNYFGVSESILRNEWNEETWTAFYEGKIEPFAIQLSLVLSTMLFSERELANGNEILFSANRLQFTSTTVKVNIITQLFDRGMLSTNEAREILQMNPIENGDNYMIRGEYVDRKERE